MSEPRKPDPKDASVVATQIEQTALLYFEVAYQSLVLNGLDPNYKLLLVAKHPTGQDFVVGTLEYQEGIDIVQKYMDKRAASSEAAKNAIDRMKKGKNNG